MQKQAYAMPSSSGQPMVVESYVKAAHGKAVREWPFIMCSDSGFTEVCAQQVIKYLTQR